jgi:hypothetical protein
MLYEKQFELRALDPEEEVLMEDGVSDSWLWSGPVASKMDDETVLVDASSLLLGSTFMVRARPSPSSLPSLPPPQ